MRTAQQIRERIDTLRRMLVEGLLTPSTSMGTFRTLATHCKDEIIDLQKELKDLHGETYDHRSGTELTTQ